MPSHHPLALDTTRGGTVQYELPVLFILLYAAHVSIVPGHAESVLSVRRSSTIAPVIWRDVLSLRCLLSDSLVGVVRG